MKRLYALGIAILALVALAGCNDTKEFAESLERAIVLTATHEGVSPDTKTLRMDDGSTWWNPKEEISVFYGSGSNGGNKFISQNTTLAETTEFVGTIAVSGNKDYWVVYPYSTDNTCNGVSITIVIPSEQTGVEGNFSDNAFPAIGKSKSLTMPFWNICGGIKFSVSRTDIKSVTFKGNNGEVLAGKVKVAFGDDGKPEVVEVLDGIPEVTLTAPDGGTFKAGKYYYMTLLPASLDGGFTITFTTAYELGAISSSKSQTVKRSIFGTLKNIDNSVTEWDSNVPIPEAVDLGLPSGVKWASFNVGASKPEEYGEYFAWGETEPKTDYSWPTYKFFASGSNLSNVKFNKYCPSTASSYWGGSGSPDNKAILDLEDDAANANWGGRWRMPSIDEYMELWNTINCEWSWTSINGIYGYKVRSLKAGYTDNWIFIPAAGKRTLSNTTDVGSSGCFWLSSLFSDTRSAQIVFFYTGTHFYGDQYRWYGLSVRPVESVPIASISLEEESISMCVGAQKGLNVSFSPEKGIYPVVNWMSSDESVATVNSGRVTAIGLGSATITATTVDGGKTATCDVTVTPGHNGYEYVDLGLSVKWATFNIGATKPEEYGDYYAWGETEPKSSYSIGNYKYQWGEATKVSKYCPTDKSEFWNGYDNPDGKTTLDIDDDAAHVNWGGNWRMPTDEELLELCSNCTWTWTDNYNGSGVSGSLGTSNKEGYTDKCIFIPAAGYRDSSGIDNFGYSCTCWGSAINKDTPYWACYIDLDPSGFCWGLDRNRYYGLSVRPVCPKD